MIRESPEVVKHEVYPVRIGELYIKPPSSRIIGMRHIPEILKFLIMNYQSETAWWSIWLLFGRRVHGYSENAAFPFLIFIESFFVLVTFTYLVAVQQMQNQVQPLFKIFVLGCELWSSCLPLIHFANRPSQRTYRSNGRSILSDIFSLTDYDFIL